MQPWHMPERECTGPRTADHLTLHAPALARAGIHKSGALRNNSRLGEGAQYQAGTRPACQKTRRDATSQQGCRACCMRRP
jgi:hypothetical protein